MTVHTGEAYILRTCNADMTSYGGFVWPREGLVEAPDWSPEPECGWGLHGFLWGEGNGSLADWSGDAVWIVARISEWVDLGGKVKFPSAEVVFAGNRKDATDFIINKGARGAVIGASVVAGDYGQATAGDDGLAIAGIGGQAVAGYHGQATAGDDGMLSIKWHDGRRYRISVAYVGEDGIKPNTTYRVEGGKFVEVAE